MPGPGEYRPDPTEGITSIADLPKPKVRCLSRNYRRRPCLLCGHSAYRDRLVRRSLHDLGNPLTGRPCDRIVIYSQHYCTRCRKYFNADMTDLASPGSHYTRRVVDTAVRLVVEDGLPYRTASWSLWRDHRVFVPYATIQNWVEDEGEKGGATNRRRLPRLGAVGLLGLHRRRGRGGSAGGRPAGGDRAARAVRRGGRACGRARLAPDQPAPRSIDGRDRPRAGPRGIHLGRPPRHALRADRPPRRAPPRRCRPRGLIRIGSGSTSQARNLGGVRAVWDTHTASYIAYLSEVSCVASSGFASSGFLTPMAD